MARDESESKKAFSKAVKLAFGKVLRGARTKGKGKKVTQEELAYESGYSRTYIYKIEIGEYQPSLTALILLARQLDVSPVALLKATLSELENNNSKQGSK